MKNSLHTSEFWSESFLERSKSKISSLRSHTSAMVLSVMMVSMPVASAENEWYENFYNYEGATIYHPTFGFPVSLEEEKACEQILEEKFDESAIEENAQIQKDYVTCTELNNAYLAFLKEKKEELDELNLAEQQEKMKDAIHQHPHVAGNTK